ncbi:MAG: hypothetical protein ACQERJ_02650 [Bacillota bacterium]
MKKNLLIIFILAGLITILSFPADATFSTGTGKHTFKIDSFRVTPEVSLQSFLVGFGIDQQSAVNIKLTQASESKDDENPSMNFLIPSYDKIDEPGYEFSLRGPVVDINYQYIPKHRLFITPNSLNALQVGLKHYSGEVYDTTVDNNPVDEIIKKTYLMVGVLSRSRWDQYNIFSDFKFSYDMEEVGGWLFDSQVGLEYKFKENVRLQASYRALASSAASEQGVSIGVKVHY